MKPEQKDELQHLEKFHCVISTLRRTSPFLAVVILKNQLSATDQEVELHEKPYWKAHPRVLVSKETEEPSKNSQKAEITEEGKHLLMAIATKFGFTTTEYFRELKMSLATASRLKQRLENAGFIKSHKLSVSRRGGEIQIMEIMEKGYKIIGLSPEKYRQGKGSIIHRWWTHRIIGHLNSAGLMGKLEYNLNGKAADVVLKTGNGWIAYEVQLSSSMRPELISDLILKDIAAGYEKVIVCVESVKGIELVKNIIMELHESKKVEKECVEKVEVVLLVSFI